MTPDARYIVVRGRLWRRSNPHLAETERQTLVDRLMRSRRAVREALTNNDQTALLAARTGVQEAKVGLGERGPVWWEDGEPDLNRHLARNTLYAAWYAKIDETA